MIRSFIFTSFVLEIVGKRAIDRVSNGSWNAAIILNEISKLAASSIVNQIPAKKITAKLKVLLKRVPTKNINPSLILFEI